MADHEPKTSATASISPSMMSVAIPQDPADAPRQAVFETAELRELIISFLPAMDIICSQRVATSWLDSIQRSTDIQEKLFLRRREPDEYWSYQNGKWRKVDASTVEHIRDANGHYALGPVVGEVTERAGVKSVEGVHTVAAIPVTHAVNPLFPTTWHRNSEDLDDHQEFLDGYVNLFKSRFGRSTLEISQPVFAAFMQLLRGRSCGLFDKMYLADCSEATVAMYLEFNIGSSITISTHFEKCLAEMSIGELVKKLLAQSVYKWDEGASRNAYYQHNGIMQEFGCNTLRDLLARFEEETTCIANMCPRGSRILAIHRMFMPTDQEMQAVEGTEALKGKVYTAEDVQ